MGFTVHNILCPSIQVRKNNPFNREKQYVKPQEEETTITQFLKQQIIKYFCRISIRRMIKRAEPKPCDLDRPHVQQKNMKYKNVKMRRRGGQFFGCFGCKNVMMMLGKSTVYQFHHINLPSGEINFFIS